MNLTTIFAAIAREMDKEMQKEITRRIEPNLVRESKVFNARDVRNFFDRACSIVATREYDKFRREGAKK